MNSTHKCEVVPVIMEKHPNADSLSIVKVFGGYTCCVRTEDWLGIEKAVYIPPDSIVKTTRPEFSFLDDGKGKGESRVKAKKLRGVVSFGCLIPAPEIAVIGEDWAEKLEVRHYEPPTEFERGGAILGGDCVKPPQIHVPKYDIDALRRYKDLFTHGEEVLITEKVDGTNARFVFHNDEFYCGSRNEWRAEFPNYDHVTIESLTSKGVDEERAKQIIDRLNNGEKKTNVYWQILNSSNDLRLLLMDNPDLVLFGEIYGWVQKLRYGHKQGEVSFVAFDAMKDGQWLEPKELIDLCEKYNVPFVFTFEENIFDFEKLCELSDGDSFMSRGERQIREGIVIQPIQNRWAPEIGRVKLKLVSGAYLEKMR